MKLVYMGDSKSPAERRAGSSPAAGTTFNSPCFLARVFLCLKKGKSSATSCGIVMSARWVRVDRDEVLVLLEVSTWMNYAFRCKSKKVFSMIIPRVLKVTITICFVY